MFYIHIFWSFVCFFFHLLFHLSVLRTLILKWDLSKWNRIRERRVQAAMDQESCAHSCKVQMWQCEELTVRGVHSASLKPLLNINLEGTCIWNQWRGSRMERQVDMNFWLNDKFCVGLLVGFEWQFSGGLWNLFLSVCRHPLWLWECWVLSGRQQFLFCWDSPCCLKLRGEVGGNIWKSPEDSYVKYGVLRYNSNSGCTSTWDIREMHSLMFGECRERVTGENLKVKTHSEGIDMNKNFSRKISR